MTQSKSKAFSKVFSELKHRGLLLQQDARFPNAVSLITGGPVRGSWWAYPKSHLIFDILEQLSSHPDVLITKLLSKKVTFVHHKLWPTIYVIGTAREDWQMKNLSPMAKSMLKKLDKDGELQTDILITVGGYESKKLSKAVNELENVLLISSRQFHTERGKHARRLETWPHWAKQTGVADVGMGIDKAKALLEKTVDGLNRQYQATAKLPWRT